jgi:glycosyltransferase involved in cell wall biosynthesis
VEAFSQMPDKRLIVIGDGPLFAKIHQKAGSNVELLGYQPFEVLKDHMQRARAFIFAAEEDFGIVPVEAQACGTPVIAYGKGGALETVIENRTGLFFHEQSLKGVIDAVCRFERIRDGFDPDTIRRNALRFSKERFRKEFKAFVDKAISEHFETAHKRRDSSGYHREKFLEPERKTRSLLTIARFLQG